MSYFVKHGAFPAEQIDYPRRYRNLIITCVWNLVMSVPILRYVIPFVASGSTLSLGVVAILLLTGTIILHRVSTAFTQSIEILFIFYSVCHKELKEMCDRDIATGCGFKLIT